MQDPSPKPIDPRTISIRPTPMPPANLPSAQPVQSSGGKPPSDPPPSEVDDDADEPPSKPRIQIMPGKLHETVAAAERVLADDGRYFHAGGPIIRIVDRTGAGIVSEQVNDQTLTAVLSSKIEWEKRSQKGDWILCDPPANVVQNLLRGQDRPHLVPLLGLARQPFYGSDQRLITKRGYDSDTGIYADFDDAEYEFTDLSKASAEHSRDRLNWLLSEFPFATEADRAAALAAMLTAAIRPSLPQAPAFNISATRSGSGKSYLASLIALMAGPGEPYNISYPTRAEEATKVVLAMLLEKPAVILFDDMQTDWKSFGALNKALTSATTTERLLGSSSTATARTNVLFLGTGNNIEPEQDMRRRVVSIYLAPRSETPSLCKFRDDRPLDYVRKKRARVVQAALTIVAAYQAAGQPLAQVPSIGTYETWSTLCRHSLMWLGEPDPAQSLIDQVSNDVDQLALAAFLDEWDRRFGSRPVTVRKLIASAEQHSEFMEAISELPVIDGRFVNPGKLGWYLKRNRGRRAGNRWIEPAVSSERRAWRVVSE